MINPASLNIIDMINDDYAKHTKNHDGIDITLFKIKEDMFGVQNCYMTDGFFDGTPSKECFGRKTTNTNGCGFICCKNSDEKMFFFKTYPMLFTYGHYVFFKPTLAEIMDQLPQSAKNAKKIFMSANIDGIHEQVTVQKDRHLGIVTVAYPLNELNGEHIESGDGTLRHIDMYKTCYHTRTRQLVPIYCDNSCTFEENYRHCSHSDYDKTDIYKECRNVEPDLAAKLNSYDGVDKNLFAVAIETNGYIENSVNPLDVIPDSLLNETNPNYVFAFPYWQKLEPSNVKNSRCLCTINRNTDLFGGVLWIIHIVTPKTEC